MSRRSRVLAAVAAAVLLALLSAPGWGTPEAQHGAGEIYRHMMTGR